MERWQLFKEKEYLGKLDNQPEVGKALEQFILRFEREPKNNPELSCFHKFDSKGKVTGVRDMEIVDYIVDNVNFFVRGEIPYYYEHGVFIEDTKGVKLNFTNVFDWKSFWNSGAWKCDQRILASEFDTAIWIYQCGNYVAKNASQKEV